MHSMDDPTELAISYFAGSKCHRSDPRSDFDHFVDKKTTTTSGGARFILFPKHGIAEGHAFYIFILSPTIISSECCLGDKFRRLVQKTQTSLEYCNGVVVVVEEEMGHWATTAAAAAVSRMDDLVGILSRSGPVLHTVIPSTRFVMSEDIIALYHMCCSNM